ncbi:hypothetical protein H4217_001382 [Coemansia sp. RSA 1939]|nr:hypothetical protein H4217_001382 [Coemansia sp. RSA 1939]KAJ2615311.1 hypothetical protein EV177_001641 [Coemansia sp. RSA 1804]KAJ2691997.1 hypothetical protein GGH99_002024 [Coemansia sp. RSA 1285]
MLSDKTLTSHKVRLKHADVVRPLFVDDDAIYVPDIALDLSPGFQTVRTSIRHTDNDDDNNNKNAKAKPRRVAYQIVPTAVRAAIVKLLHSTIVHLGQAQGVGFGRLEPTEYPAVPVHLAGAVQMDRTKPKSKSGSNRDRNDASETTVALVLDGPRHVGKSHILLQLSVLLASEPGVAVALISDCSALLLEGADQQDDRRRYSRVVEYFACVLCRYPGAAALAAEWDEATRNATAAHELRAATDDFFVQLRVLCSTKNVTLVAVLDGYEKIADARADETILTLATLSRLCGAQTIISANPLCAAVASISASARCIFASCLTPAEARNVYKANAVHLKLTDAEQMLVFNAAQMHPLDIARTLSRYENIRIGSVSIGQHAAVLSAIGDQKVEQEARITQMHAHFVSKTVAAYAAASSLSPSADAAAQTPSVYHQGIAVASASALSSTSASPSEDSLAPTVTTVIDTQASHALTPAINRIRSAAFSIFHDIEAKAHLLADPQFVAFIEGARWPCCVPPAARSIIYNTHSNGSLQSQFSLAYASGSGSNKFQVDPRIRLRYFDAALLDAGQFAAAATNPLAPPSSLQWGESMTFAVASGSATYLYDSRTCALFDSAIELAIDFIDADRSQPPEFIPRASVAGSSRRTMKSTTVLPLPRLGFEDAWIPSSICAALCFPGSFMLAITRIDVFQGSAFVRCEYEVAWIANDPLCLDNTAQKYDTATVSEAKTLTASESASGCDSGHNTSESTLKMVKDYEQTYGPLQSWSAKAIRLFPKLLEHCHALASLENVTRICLLVLAPASRVERLSQLRLGLLEECGISYDHPLANNNDVGIMSIEDIASLTNRNIGRYV